MLSPPSNDEVENEWSYTPSPIRLHDVHQDNFNFAQFNNNRDHLNNIMFVHICE